MKNNIQKTILEILEQNKEKWITVFQIQKHTGFNRSCINTSINAMDKKGIIQRKMVKSSRGRNKNLIKYKKV